MVKDMTGINLAESKQRAGIRPRVPTPACSRPVELRIAYRQLLESGDGSELVAFCNALTTNLTSFFRESHHFDYLRDQFLVPRRGEAGQRSATVFASGPLPVPPAKSRTALR